MKKYLLFLVFALLIIGCGESTTVVKEPAPISITAQMQGTDISVISSDCEGVKATRNTDELVFVCNGDGSGTAHIQAVYRENKVIVTRLDGTLLNEYLFDYEVPASEPDSLYMPNHGMDVVCPAGRRWCGLHTNCLKISVYGY